MAKLDLLKGTLPLLVLSVIADGELYGYEIAQRIRDRSGNLFAPSEGSLYPTLHRLEGAGALERPMALERAWAASAVLRDHRGGRVAPRRSVGGVVPGLGRCQPGREVDRRGP